MDDVLLGLKAAGGTSSSANRQNDTGDIFHLRKERSSWTADELYGRRGRWTASVLRLVASIGVAICRPCSSFRISQTFAPILIMNILL